MQPGLAGGPRNGPADAAKLDMETAPITAAARTKADLFEKMDMTSPLPAAPVRSIGGGETAPGMNDDGDGKNFARLGAKLLK